MPKPKNSKLDKLGLSKTLLGKNATNNTKWTDAEIKKSDLLVLRNNKTDVVTNVIAPNGFQVGLTQSGYNKNLLVTGDVAATGLTGSLTQLYDGNPYLRSGTNIAITTGSDGSVTISSDNVGTAIDIAGLSNTLTNSTIAKEDLLAIADVDDSNNVKKIDVEDFVEFISNEDAGTSGLQENYGKLRVHIKNLTETAIDVSDDYIAFMDASASDVTKRESISDLVDAIRGTTTTTGLTSTNGVLSVDIANQNNVTADASDVVLIGDASDSFALKKTTVSSIQNLTLDLNSLSAAVVNVADDSIVFIDADGNTSKKDTIVDFVSSVAGSGLSAASGQLNLSNNSVTVTAGDGLQGGGSVALGSSVTLNIDVSDFAGTGLEDDGSENLRISSAVAGTGLTGGGGAPLSLSFGNTGNDVAKGSNTITISAGDGLSTGGTAIIGNASSTIVLDIEPEDFAGTGLNVSGNNIHTYLSAGSNVTITTGSEGNLMIAASTGSAISGLDVSHSGSTPINTVTKMVFTSSIVTNRGSGEVLIQPVIGAAEDGDYTDGLFTSFNYNTPIGTAIDKINEILKTLAPAAIPSLDDIDCDTSDGISAKLAFGTSNNMQSLGTPYFSVGTAAGFSAVDVNGVYSAAESNNNIRKGIYNGTTSLSGDLNEDIEPHVYTSGVVNYVSNSFNDGHLGSLILLVNGAEVHSIDLSNTSIGAGTPGSGTGTHLNNGSGFINLSTTASAKLADGSEFVNYKYRTGKYQIGTAAQRQGWNYARVVHVVNNVSGTTNYIEWVNDADGNNITATGNSISDINLSSSIYISGVRYALKATGNYKTRINNAYKHVFNTDNITFSATNASISALTKNNLDTGNGETHEKIIHVTQSFTSSTAIMLNQAITISTNATHPFSAKSLSSGGSTTAPQFLIFSASDPNNDQNEYFVSESKRLVSGSYDTQASVTSNSNKWDGTLHFSSSANHSDGLQFYNSKLFSPLNTLNGGNFSGFTNGYANNPNYSGIKNTRTFFRSFINNSGDAARDFKVSISGSNTIITNLGTALDKEKVKILFKCPETTDWMDLGAQFAYHSTSYGHGGRIGTFDNSLNAVNFFTFGTGSVSNNNHIVVAVIASSSWTGSIGSMHIDFPATANNAVVASNAVQNLSSSFFGQSGNLSFGTSNDLAGSGYTSVTNAAGLGIENVNNLYEQEVNSGNARIGLFRLDNVITGTVNSTTTANLPSFISASFKDGHTGSLILEVNGSSLQVLDLYNFNLGNAGNNSSLNANGSGFFNISTASVGKTSDNLPDYRRFYRKTDFKIATADQRNGHNYAKVIHRIDGQSDRNTNFLEWVNDNNANNISISNATYNRFGSNTFFDLSGVKYFVNTTGSFSYKAQNAYRNVYSDRSDAISTDTTNFSVTAIKVSGSNLTSGGNTVAAASRALQTLDTSTSNPHLASFDVTASLSYTGGNSLPTAAVGSSTQRRGAFNSTVSHVFNAKNGSVGSTNSAYLLVFSASNTSNASTREYFTSETYRIVSASYTAQNQVTVGSNAWSSTTSMNDQGNYPEHATGLLIYNELLMSPKKGPNGGDFRDINDGGSIISPKDNVNYSSLTNSSRDYYRYFLNNTVNSAPQVTITVYGDAVLVPRTTALSGKNIYIDAKIPGKTGYLDTALGSLGSGNTQDGKGALNGTLDGTIDGAGATNICTFNGQTLFGTFEGQEYLVLRIVTSDSWTGYISRIDVSYS